jgi:hypothetical protein
VLGDLAVFNAVQIIDAGGYFSEGGLGDGEYEVTFAEYLVSDLRRSTTRCLRLGSMDPPGQALSL